MTDHDLEQLDAVLKELETLLRREKAPTRHHARAILVSLGQLLLAGSAEAAVRADRARDLGARSKGWERAVSEEMTLACTEHVQGVDPRFLDHPRFDFEYVVSARERLEARFRALESLGLAVDEDLLTKVTRADSMLAPYLRRREGQQGGN